MANTQAMCDVFKRDILNGHHAFGTSVTRGATTKDDFKAALYLSSATKNASTTAYNTTGEINGTNYTAGGIAVPNATAPSLDGSTAIWTPSGSLVWAALTQATAFNCVVIYNDTQSGDPAVSVHTFGDQTVTAGTFTLTMPANAAATALIRIA